MIFLPEVFMASPVIGLGFSYTIFTLLCLYERNG
jgi:hypothetical protein